MLTPESSHLATGAMPEARRMLLWGQCAMPRPLDAYSWQSSSSRQQQWANQASSLSHPTSLIQHHTRILGKHLALLHSFTVFMVQRTQHETTPSCVDTLPPDPSTI